MEISSKHLEWAELLKRLGMGDAAEYWHENYLEAEGFRPGQILEAEEAFNNDLITLIIIFPKIFTIMAKEKGEEFLESTSGKRWLVEVGLALNLGYIYGYARSKGWLENTEEPP